MKIQFELTRKAVIVGVLLAAVPVYGYLFVKKQVFPYTQVLPIARNVVRYVQAARVGDDRYVEAAIGKQSVKAPVGEGADKTIETSQLPLKLKFFWLGETQGFAEAGGAIADVNKHLVVMSRLGEFYSFSNNRLQKLEYGVFPNRLREYILSSKAGLNSDSMRAHSLAYDAANSRLVVAYTRYVSPGFNKFVLSALSIDPNTLQRKGGVEGHI